MIGKTISHYKILEKLGEGGMGVVYKAQDTKLDRIVALKFLPKPLLCDEEAKTRFVHEAKTASALNHPNITTIHEIDEVEDECFITMEYIAGRSVKELLKQKTLSLKEILDIAIQTAEGLNAAHKKDITHRDIKSDNIMVTKEGQAKIMDFGLAKLKGVTKLTKTGTTLGTTQYMSPEQAQGKEVDHRSDIFSFGVVLYEMITGQLPFKGEYEQSVIYSILNEEPEPVSKIRPEVSLELEGIVKKALQKKSERRYLNTGALLADLRRIQAGAQVRPALPKRIQKTKRLALGIGSVLLLVAVVLMWPVIKQWLGLTEVKAKSLAVLSFENLGTEADGYLASGLAEDLAIKLRKLAGFRVASSEDIRRLTKEELLPKQIASRLKVEYALGGSLLKAGEWIRVNVEVIEQASGEVIWSEQFRRKFTNIHEFHDEVSRKIAKALEVRLSPAEQLALKEKPTKSPEAYDHYLKGRHYYYNVTFRDNELAEREFERALQLDPDYSLTLAGLADAYVQRYKERFDYDEYWLDSSKVLIDRALALDSDLAEAYESRAEVLLQEDNITGAREAAEKAKDLQPDWDEPYVHLGNIYKGRGERSKALAMFDTALSLRPSVDALCGRGNIFEIRGQMDSAEAAYQSALKLNPDHDRPYLKLGGLYEELHEGEKAESLYQRAIEVRPDRATGYAKLSDKLFRRGSVREGEDLLRSFVERYPYNWDAYEALYDYLAWIEDYANAVKVIEESTRRNPERVWPHLLLAISHAEKLSQESESNETVGASEKAILAIDRALALRPNSGRVLESAGHVYASLNRPEEAMQYYHRAVKARPGSGRLLANIAINLLRIREYEKATEFSLEAVQQSPGISRYYFILRHTLAPLNRWQEFFEIIKQAAVEYPDDPDILYYLAQEQCVAGLYDEAISVYQRALEIKDDHITLARLAFALWLSGDVEAALVRFREAKDSYSSGHWIVAILRSEGRHDEIEDHLESIKVQSPDYKSGIDYWVEVAAPYYESMRRYDDALAVYTEYLESGEETCPAERGIDLAYCYRQKGEFDSARLVLEDLAETSAARDLPHILIALALLEAIVAPNLTPALRLAEEAQAQLSIPDNWVTEQLMYLQYASGETDEAMKSLAQLGVGFSWTSYWGSVHYGRAQLAATNGLSDAGSYLDDVIQSLTQLARGDYGLGSLAYMGAGILPYRALALIRAGRQDEAIREIKRAIKMEPESADVAYYTACAYSFMGDTALALQWLETAVERGYQELWWARVDPDLDPLRKLPRFQEIMNDWDTRLRKLFD